MTHAFLWFIGFVLILFQALPWNVLFPPFTTPNLAFAVVVIAGFRSGSSSNWPLAFLLGYVLESLSGSPRGLISLINLMALLVIRIMAGIILFERLSSQLIMLFFLCTAAHMALLAAAGAIAYHPFSALVVEAALHSGLITTLSVPLLLFSNKTVRETEH